MMHTGNWKQQLNKEHKIYLGEKGTTNINFKFTSLFSKNNNNYKVYFFRRFISLK